MNNVVNSIILNIEKRDRNFLFQVFIVIFYSNEIYKNKTLNSFLSNL